MARVRIYPRGVTFHAGNLARPWQARIWFRGRRYSLGYFSSCMGAEVAYNNMRNLIREETGKLPLPPELLQRIEQEGQSAGSDPHPDPLHPSAG